MHITAVHSTISETSPIHLDQKAACIITATNHDMPPTTAARRTERRPYFISANVWPLLAILMLVGLHIPHLFDPPSGFHAWRETDTATVAENFYLDGMHFLQPEVNVISTKIPQLRIVGMELPVYNYSAALLYRTFTFSHAWPRLLSLFGAIACLVFCWQLVFLLTQNSHLAGIAVYLLALAPLFFFYAIKIQPDMWALAAVMGGFFAFLSWLQRPTWRWFAAIVLLLTVAASIKPVYLFVGLPMLTQLHQREGWKFLRRPAPWLLAGAIMVVPVFWFRYARHLTEDFGQAYFYLGSNWWEEVKALGELQFYQNVFLTWPFELGIGLPFVPFFLLGCKRLKLSKNRSIICMWALGCLIVFAAAAGHCATPHDYYYLPLVPMLVLVTAIGVNAALQSPYRTLRRFTLLLLFAAPLYTSGRLQARFQPAPDFFNVRRAVNAHIDTALPALTLDTMPGGLLYRTGLRGFQLNPLATVAQLRQAMQAGARYLVFENEKKSINGALDAIVVGPIVKAGNLHIYGLYQADVTWPADDATVLLNNE